MYIAINKYKKTAILYSLDTPFLDVITNPPNNGRTDYYSKFIKTSTKEEAYAIIKKKKLQLICN